MESGSDLEEATMLGSPVLRRLIGVVLALVVASAMLVPAAQSKTFIAGSRYGTPVAQAPTAGSFDWADAGIGAGVAVGLLLLAGGGVLVLRRHHGRLAV